VDAAVVRADRAIVVDVLGPLAEEAFRQTLTIWRGSFATFIERPLSVRIVGITLTIIAAAPLMRRFQPKAAA